MFEFLFSRGPRYPKKKVLVLEGGGMRGIFLTGVLQAFTDKRYNPFKLIIGSSAGSINGTAFAVDRINLVRDAYFTKLLTGDFIHIGNVLNYQKHVLDLDWMVSTFLGDENPFDGKTLKKAPLVLITATHCAENAPPDTVYLNSKKDDIIMALKATAAVPFLYRGFVQYGNYSFLDGGLMDPIPYRKALDLGFKEDQILVVVTRKKGYRKKEESFLVKMLYESYYKKQQFAPLIKAMENRFRQYNNTLDELEERYTGIDVIYPSDNFKVSRLTQEGKKILEGFEQGVEAGKHYLKGN
jgi:predicted patatin/cPLA2 family phospholipase